VACMAQRGKATPPRPRTLDCYIKVLYWTQIQKAARVAGALVRARGAGMGGSAGSASGDRIASPLPAPQQAMDRRTRHRERRRDEVYAVAVALFLEQGFDNTTMDQIADRADVARATVFNYFPRKTAFLDEWTVRRRARSAAALREVDISDWPLDKIMRRYMTEMARQSEETRPETVALLSVTLQQTDFLAHPALADELAELVASARRPQRSGAPDDSRAWLVGLVIATSYFAVLSRWTLAYPEPFDLEAALLAMVEMVIFGYYGPRTGLDGLAGGAVLNRS
jgi:AcrR family transcriptional regulator